MSDPRRTRLEERRDQALADLRALDAQVEAGEIDDEHASVLRGRYQAEAADALLALGSLEPATRPGRSRRRLLLGLGAFIIVAGALTVALVNAVEPRPEGGFVTGGVAADVSSEGTDLASISNEEMEAVVAANPDVIPMRLALARRYVEEGQFSEALTHYMYVLDRETNPEALMYLGWMTYLSGDADTGAALLQESLAIAPDEPLAQWFLANVLYYGLDDVDGARPLLDDLVASGMLPEDLATEARQMLGGAG